MGKREEEGDLVVLNVLFSRIDQLSLVVLYSTTNLHKCRSAERSQVTIGKESTYSWHNEKRVKL